MTKTRMVCFGVLAIFGGALLYGFRWRHTLPAVTIPARVAPNLSSLPKISACWIETGKIFADTASGILVRHPHGDLLIDAGDSSHLGDEISGYPTLARLWLRFLPGALAPSELLPSVLTRAGVDPAKIRLLVTHAHLDHVGGWMDLPATVPVLLSQAELDWVLGDRGFESPGVIRAHAARLKGHMQPIVFQPTKYEIFDESADIFGDGSVVVVPLYGHTPGSVGVFVNLSSGQRLFHIGDAAHDWRGLEKRQSEAPILANTNWSTAKSEAVLSSLSALHQAAPELHMIPAHSRPAWQEAFGTEGHCIP